MATYFVSAGGGTIGVGDYRGIWSNSQTWAVGDRVSPTQAYATGAARGYIYECTTGGAGGASEPTWVYTTPDTSTTTSGSAVFTCRNPDSWAEAGVYLDQGLQRATSGSDVIVIKYDGVPTVDAEISADTTYTTANSVSIISASADDTGTAYTPTAMGTSYWIGNSTTTRAIQLSPTAKDIVYVFGLTFRNASSGVKNIHIYGTEGSQITMEECYFWLGTSGSSSRLHFGNGTTGNWTGLKGCTLRFGSTSQKALFNNTILENCTVSSSGSAPTTLMADGGGGGGQYRGTVSFTGCDLSHITGTLASDNAAANLAIFDRCKLGSGVTVLAAQTSNPTRASQAALLLDCSSGDTHGIFGYYDALGSVVSDTGIYFTSGAAAQSWKIVTTANASFWSPFITPPIELYHTGTSAITPYLEILRDGSTTAYQNDEIWAEFAAKVTASSTKATFYNDRKDIDTGTAAADQAAGAGTGSWTGEAASAWSGKIDSGTSFTPAEAGHITARIFVGEPSITVYVDPQIRT